MSEDFPDRYRILDARDDLDGTTTVLAGQDVDLEYAPRSALIAVYALCGFANFASVGIQIGGISVLAPSRRHDLSRIGLLAMFGGAIATMMGACVVGVLT